MNQESQDSQGTNEEVLFSEWSEGWERLMPTTLLTYKDGTMDLHCQTGDHHRRSLLRASDILKERGLKFTEKGCGLGSSGMYYPVIKL